MTVKTIERIFNKHPVKSVAITVCTTCLILAYLIFGSGLINWDKINQNHMQVIAQNIEQKTSELEQETISKSTTNSDEDTQIEDRQEEVEYTGIYRIIYNIIYVLVIIAMVLASIVTVLGVFKAFTL